MREAQDDHPAVILRHEVPKNLLRSDEKSNTRRTGRIYAVHPKNFL